MSFPLSFNGSRRFQVKQVQLSDIPIEEWPRPSSLFQIQWELSLDTTILSISYIQSEKETQIESRVILILALTEMNRLIDFRYQNLVSNYPGLSSDLYST